MLPLIQAATAIITSCGGLENALIKAKPAPPAEDDSINDHSLSDISASENSMTAGSLDMSLEGKPGKYIDESDEYESSDEDSQGKDIDLDDILGDLIDSPQPSPRVKRENSKKLPKIKQLEPTANKPDNIDWDSLVGGLIDEDGSAKIRPAATASQSAAPVVIESSNDDWKNMIDELLEEKTEAPEVVPVPEAAPATKASVESGQAHIDWTSIMKDLEGELGEAEKVESSQAAQGTATAQPLVTPKLAYTPVKPIVNVR